MTRRLITKFFEAGAQDSICSGIIRVGSFAHYLHADGMDAESGAMSDGRESLTFNALDPPRGVPVTGMIAGHSLVNVTNTSNKPLFIDVSQYNEAFAFCATFGAYSTDMHRQMMQETSEYKGNPKYTHAIQYDLDILLAILTSQGINHEHAKVTYDDKIIVTRELGPLFNVPDPRSFESIRKTIFTKPTRFHIERELRVVLYLDPPPRGKETRDLRGFKDAIYKEVIVY